MSCPLVGRTKCLVWSQRSSLQSGCFCAVPSEVGFPVPCVDQDRIPALLDSGGGGPRGGGVVSGKSSRRSDNSEAHLGVAVEGAGLAGVTVIVYRSLVNGPSVWWSLLRRREVLRARKRQVESARGQLLAMLSLQSTPSCEIYMAYLLAYLDAYIHIFIKESFCNYLHTYVIRRSWKQTAEEREGRVQSQKSCSVVALSKWLCNLA